MAGPLDYAPPSPLLSWPGLLRAAFTACVPGSAAVLAAGVVSTVSMRYFQAREGRPVLQGAPHQPYYQLWIGLIPLVIATALLAAAWWWAVWRCPPRDRMVVGVLAAWLQAGLWCVAAFWILYNGEIAFP